MYNGSHECFLKKTDEGYHFSLICQYLKMHFFDLLSFVKGRQKIRTVEKVKNKQVFDVKSSVDIDEVIHSISCVEAETINEEQMNEFRD